MSLSVCIPDLIEQGALKGAKAARAQSLYDDLVRQYESKFGRAAAESMATTKTIAALEADVAHKKLVVGLTAKAQSNWLGAMRAAVGGDGAPFDPFLARAKLESLDKRVDAVRGQYLAGFSKMLEKHRRNLLGEVRNRDDLMLVLRERFGEATGDANARELAEAMGSTMDALRVRRNAAGGNTKKLDEYVFPQRHDSRLVRAVPFEEWRALPAIDNARIRDTETGEWATGLRREAILRASYESIVTDGANSTKPGAIFGGSMANQRAEARTIHFASADDWMEYQQRFGGDDNIFDIFVGHVSAMAREIALMEDMGPNPAAMIRFQKDWLRKSIGQHGTQAQIDKVPGYANRLQDVFDELTAANKVPDSRRLALTFSGVRAVQVAAKLGSAVLSVVPDFATMMKTAHYNRVPVMRALGRYFSLWNPGNKADRELAVRLGLVTDDWLALSSASYRYTGEELTGEISRRLADFVLRSQGLARHTRNGQWAFGMEFFGHLSAMRARDFANLDPALQRQMQGYGISAKDWDAWRGSKVTDERGSSWILPENVKDRGAAERILQMVLSETDFAVLMPDIRTRTQLNSAFRPGTWKGEIAKSTLLFKSFPMTMINLHGRRMLAQEGGWSKAGYGMSLFAMLVAGGALSAQIKTIASGKDPAPMDDEKFLAKAIVQSGGLGIFGDLLYNSTNSFGGGMVQTLAGPLLGQTLPNFAQLTIGNATRALDGDESTDTRIGRDLSNLLRYEVPGGNLWYLRQTWQRGVMDNVQRLIDPAADEFYDRQAKRAEKEGTAFWLPPGEGLDGARAPDLGNAWGSGDEEGAMPDRW